MTIKQLRDELDKLVAQGHGDEAVFYDCLCSLIPAGPPRCTSEMYDNKLQLGLSRNEPVWVLDE